MYENIAEFCNTLCREWEEEEEIKESYLNISESVHCDNTDVITEWGQGSKKQSRFPKNLQDRFVDSLFELIRLRSIIGMYCVFQRLWASCDIREWNK